jgi:hypothetical protein
MDSKSVVHQDARSTLDKLAGAAPHFWGSLCQNLQDARVVGEARIDMTLLTSGLRTQFVTAGQRE